MQKFHTLRKTGACKTHREHAVAVQKGKGEFALYQEMIKVVQSYKHNAAQTIEEALESFKGWLENDFEVTSRWQKEDASRKALLKLERYLRAHPQKSQLPDSITFKFDGELYTGFKPDFVYHEELEDVFWLSGITKQTLPVLQLVKFSAGKQKVGCGIRGRSLEATVATHPFTLGAIFYAQQYFAKRNTKVYAVKVSFDALTSEMDNKVYWETGNFPQYSENMVEKDSSVSSVFVFYKGALVRWFTQKNSGESSQILDLPYEKYFSKITSLIRALRESKTCPKADCEKCMLYNRCHYTEPPLAIPEREERQVKVEDIHLSEEQERVVGAKSGIFRVLATAGSGKTFCMVLRIIRLIEDGVEPSSILLISFSNIAVDELKSRIQKMLAVYGYDEFVNVNDFTIVTFNSLGYMLIKRYYEQLGYTECPELIDNIEQYDVVTQVVKNAEKIEGVDYENPYLKFGSKSEGVVAKLSNLFDEMKREKIETFADYDKHLGLTEKINLAVSDEAVAAAKEERRFYRLIFKAFETYVEIMKSRNLVDYADQSILVETLIKQSFEDGVDYILDLLTFEHIVVDEFQDSNEFQLRFVKSLMGSMRFKSLMVVGDDSQAIYGFNHTSPEGIIHFDEKLGVKVTDLELSETRRFGQDVCDIANAVIAPNKEKVEKTIHSSQQLSEFTPRLIGFDSKETEYETIAMECKKLIDSGVHPEDIIFMSSRNNDFNAILQAMNNAGVPAMKLSERFIANSRVIAIIALAKFVLDFDDTAALMDYLNEAYGNTFFDYSPEKIESIVKREKNQFLKIFIPMSDKEKLKELVNLIKSVDVSHDITAKVFVDKVLAKAKIYKNAYTLAAYIVKYEKYQSEDEAKLEGRYPAVTLSTVWKAKGGEWDYVFCSLTSFDSNKSLNEKEIEEKRRLIFTMLTRMKKGLTVTSVKASRKKFGGEEKVFPNRFYDELKKIEGFETSEVADEQKSRKKKEKTSMGDGAKASSGETLYENGKIA